ncbi:MAG TPA: Holliday junction branch migration protein RuvA [Polyangiaceae bacterium]|nr:Holliday junction branch migration protein RuvA [Polyangiaceae bacterium]
MIGWLRGRVISEEPSGLILDVGGVGYELTAPVGTLGRAASTGQASGEVELWVHTHVREDALELFGFASELERRVFRLLVSVPNVGPKTAVGVLGALPLADLSRAISARDLGRLGKVPGIGKKTAERLVVELVDKLPALVPAEGLGKGMSGKAAPAAGNAQLLLKALVNMGYRPAEAERAVEHLGKRTDAEPLGDLLRSALAFLTA